MIKVPLDQEEYLDKGLQVLYDWACQVTNSDEEVEKERGVIHEEWRSGRGANERMMQKWLPVFLHGSRYAERLAIGKMEIVNNCPPDAIRRFYRDWYRPDLQAVVAVGDFDRDSMIRHIREKFSGIPAPENPREKKYYPIPGHPETLVSIATDPEARYPIARIYYKHELEIPKTLNDYRESIKHSLFNGMISERLSELTRSENPPFIDGSSGYDELFGPASVYFAGAVCHNGRIEEGIRALMQENERVKRFGFTQTELDRMKRSLLASVEKAYNEREKQQSQSYAEEYKRNFLMTREPIPGMENEYQYYREWLPGITLEEVNALAARWITPENRVVVLTAPEMEGINVPSQEEVLAVLDEVEAGDIQAYEDVVPDKPLIEGDIAAGKVVNEKQLEKVDAVEWKLSNGATVVYKMTDFKDDEILFSAYSPGGNSLYGQTDDISADLAPTIVSMSGIGDFDQITLDKMMAGKVFSVSPYIGDLTEGFNGSSSVNDLETLLQMVYLYFTDLRVDEKAFSSYLQRMTGVLENKAASPESSFQDTLQVTSVNHHPRKRPMTAGILQEADVEAIDRIARERFSNASDYKFFFVGNIQPETFKPLIGKYIGGIPSSGKTEQWKDLEIDAPDGVITKSVYKGQEPKSVSYTVFHGDFEYTAENRIALDALCRILSTRLLEIIREDKSSVYYIGASPSVNRYPEANYKITIYYGCDPEKVEALQQIAFDEIRKLAEAGPEDKDLATAKEKLLRERETGLRENGFWLGTLTSGYLNQNGDFSEFDRFEEIVGKMTGGDIKQAAQTWFNFNNYFGVSLKPESMKP